MRGYGRAPANATRIIDAPAATRRRVRAWLIQKEGPRPDQIYQVRDDETWIGRDPRNHIFIDDDTISGQHAKLWVDEERVLRLLNVSTSNGASVNGVRVYGPVELQENDEITMGVAVLVLKRIDAPARATGGGASVPLATAPPIASTPPLAATAPVAHAQPGSAAPEPFAPVAANGATMPTVVAENVTRPAGGPATTMPLPRAEAWRQESER